MVHVYIELVKCSSVCGHTWNHPVMQKEPADSSPLAAMGFADGTALAAAELSRGRDAGSPACRALQVGRRFGDDALAYFTERLDPAVARASLSNLPQQIPA